jgi:hypothetical protein
MQISDCPIKLLGLFQRSFPRLSRKASYLHRDLVPGIPCRFRDGLNLIGPITTKTSVGLHVSCRGKSGPSLDKPLLPSLTHSGLSSTKSN